MLARDFPPRLQGGRGEVQRDLAAGGAIALRIPRAAIALGLAPAVSAGGHPGTRNVAPPRLRKQSETRLIFPGGSAGSELLRRKPVSLPDPLPRLAGCPERRIDVVLSAVASAVGDAVGSDVHIPGGARSGRVPGLIPARASAAGIGRWRRGLPAGELTNLLLQAPLLRAPCVRERCRTSQAGRRATGRRAGLGVPHRKAAGARACGGAAGRIVAVDDLPAAGGGQRILPGRLSAGVAGAAGWPGRDSKLRFQTSVSPRLDSDTVQWWRVDRGAAVFAGLLQSGETPVLAYAGGGTSFHWPLAMPSSVQAPIE
jgi:hypothetical protein